MIKVEYRHRVGFNDWLKDQGYTQQDEEDIYLCQLDDIYLNPRWYLNNFPFMREYKVSWKCYTKGLKGTPTHIKKERLKKVSAPT